MEETDCPYFGSQCGFSDPRACRSNYQNCVIYIKKEQLARIEMGVRTKTRGLENLEDET